MSPEPPGTQAAAGPPPFALTRHDLSRHPEPAGTVTLEPLAPEHAKSLGALFAGMEPWASYPYPAAGLLAFFARQHEASPRFAITCAGANLGACVLRLDWLHGPYLHMLGLAPPHQGRGLGGRVLDWMENEAQRAGARNLWVCASDFNAGAIAFYRRHGFAIVAALPGLVRDDRTEVLMRKRLGAIA